MTEEEETSIEEANDDEGEDAAVEALPRYLTLTSEAQNSNHTEPVIARTFSDSETPLRSSEGIVMSVCE